MRKQKKIKKCIKKLHKIRMNSFSLNMRAFDFIDSFSPKSMEDCNKLEDVIAIYEQANKKFQEVVDSKKRVCVSMKKHSVVEEFICNKNELNENYPTDEIYKGSTFHNTKINCIGFAFDHCLKEVLENHMNNIKSYEEQSQKFEELKSIVSCYEQEMESICLEEPLKWEIPTKKIDLVKNSASLNDFNVNLKKRTKGE